MPIHRSDTTLLQLVPNLKQQNKTEFLFFGRTGFGGDLAPLPTGLEEFDCSFSLINGGLTDSTFEGLDELVFIELSGNAFNSSIPLAFGGLLSLEFMYVADSFISGTVAYMEGMQSMFEHWVDQNPGLGGPLFPFIGSIPTLGSFSLTENALTGTIPTEFGLLGEMQQMWLYGNFLDGNIPTELGLLRQMTLLQLEGNQFVGSMPDEVCANRGFLRPLLTLGADCFDVGFTVSTVQHTLCM